MGYNYKGMVKITKAEALARFRAGEEVFRLYDDNTEAVTESEEQILDPEFTDADFGYHKGIPTMKYCLVDYEVGHGDFGVTKSMVIETEGEIQEAIQAYFSNNWDENTEQREGDTYRWFHTFDDAEYIKIGSMRMIEDTDAYVLKKYIQNYTHKFTQGR